MPLVTKKLLVCDRCGRGDEVDPGAVALDVANDSPGWMRVGGDVFLRPACSEGYGLLLARQQVERADYIQGGKEPTR